MPSRQLLILRRGYKTCYNLNAPNYLSFMRNIGIYLEQLLRQRNLQELSPAPVMFPALQTLDVISGTSTNSFHASDLLWLMHHCPCLRDLSLNDLSFDNPRLTEVPPAQTNVEFLAMNSIQIKTSKWFPLLSSMFPALLSLRLDFNFVNGGPRVDRIEKGISDWIIGNNSLTSLRIRRFELGWPMVLEYLIDAARSGTWNCQLKHFGLSTINAFDRLLERDGHTLVSSLDSLQLDLLFSYFWDLYRSFDENDPSSFPLCVFPPCNLATSTLANLTTLRFKKCGERIKPSLSWLLNLCPNLSSAILCGFIVQIDACQLHHPNLMPARTGLTELALETCFIVQADSFFSFLQHDLPRLSSLTLVHANIFGLSSAPSLDFGDRLMKLLCFAGISSKFNKCSSLCLEQTQHFRRWSWFSSPTNTSQGKLLYPSNQEYPFHVRCGIADQVLFDKSWYGFM
ncbi:hypothetical protein DM01DRAFT_1336495 [Hesseltinella vesiculosa]|uniref:RNI-like protein n=1 Tax=Hesseltinella vesiculosa TaxID=101127 RepID=A0A1X2GFK2_9FUNG|nr:hypothetical protein DM01DRAFT_1336495 [Hesseltinella vesiculosa]